MKHMNKNKFFAVSGNNIIFSFFLLGRHTFQDFPFRTLYNKFKATFFSFSELSLIFEDWGKFCVIKQNYFAY